MDERHASAKDRFRWGAADLEIGIVGRGTLQWLVACAEPSVAGHSFFGDLRNVQKKELSHWSSRCRTERKYRVGNVSRRRHGSLI